jgi:hypothetical protein
VGSIISTLNVAEAKSFEVNAFEKLSVIWVSTVEEAQVTPGSSIPASSPLTISIVKLTPTVEDVTTIESLLYSAVKPKLAVLIAEMSALGVSLPALSSISVGVSESIVMVILIALPLFIESVSDAKVPEVSTLSSASVILFQPPAELPTR